MFNYIKVIVLLFSVFIFPSCNMTEVSNKQKIEILIDEYIDHGTLFILENLENNFSNIEISIKTSIVSDKYFFMENYLNSNFTQDIIISQYLNNNNVNNLANLSGKSYFNSAAFSEIHKMDLNGNIYLIPYKSAKKYLLINKVYFDNNNIPFPKTAKDITQLNNKFSNLPNLFYINNDFDVNQNNNIFNYAFSLTDGLTLKGYSWANNLDSGISEVKDLNLDKTFDFLDSYKKIAKNIINNDYNTPEDVLLSFVLGEIGIIELNSNDLEFYKYLFNDNMKAFPYYSEFDDQEYILENQKLYIAVNKESMKEKKESIDNILKELLSITEKFEYINEENTIYEPLINIYSSVYDVKYFNSCVTNNTKFTKYFNINQSSDYLSTAVNQYLNDQMTKEEFIEYWQKDSRVSEFDLNRVFLSKSKDYISSKNLSKLISKAMKKQIDCDVSIMTHCNEIENIEFLNKMYSSATFHINEGDIYIEDINKIIPKNNNKLINSKNQTIITFEKTGKEIRELIDSNLNNLIFDGIVIVQGKYYLLNEENEFSPLDYNKKYKICTNSNFYLLDYNNTKFINTDISLKESITKWIITKNSISLKDLNNTLN